MTTNTTSARGQELWDLLTSGKAPSPPSAITNAERKRRKKKAQGEAMAEVKAEFAQACQALDLWEPTAQVRVFFKAECECCGAVHLLPELHLTDKPLIRQRHKRSGEEKDHRLAWNQVPRGLPVVVRQVSTTLTHCLACLPPEGWEYEVSQGSPQLDLFN